MKAIYLFGSALISKFDPLSKEIRALDPKLIKKALSSWGMKNVHILDFAVTVKLNNRNYEIVLPDEDVCRELASGYLNKANIIYDEVFLRWDKHNSSLAKPVDVTQKISSKEFDRKIIGRAVGESKKSSDWWRHVGAVLVKNGKILIVGHNRHLPSPHSPYANGDPRNNYHKGLNIELSTAIHAESFIIAEAARKGYSLKGTYLYLSTFPCPVCAKLVAYSGIKKLYYSGGYGVLDGENILKLHGVEIVYVEGEV